MVAFDFYFILPWMSVVALGGWVLILRRGLAGIHHASAAGQASGSNKSAILHQTHLSLQRENRRVQERLDELQSEVVSLNYSLMHDLRAPLRAIDGFSQALVEDYAAHLDDNAQDYLRRVRGGVIRLNAMIESLVEFTRLFQAPLRPQRIDLSALAREMVVALSTSAPARRVEWFIQPELQAWGDRAQLTVLLRQLLENAWKFSANRTVAHISFRQIAGVEGATIFEVRDDGIGFDPNFAGRLFGVFQRLHTADDFPGEGVGLAAVQRIVRRQGGTVQASAEPDGGAVFTFTLPGGSADVAEEPEQRGAEISALPAPMDAIPVSQPKPTAV